MDVDGRLARIEQLLAALVEREAVKDHYTTDEFARLTGKSDFTIREHCRLGRLRGLKQGSGRGRYQAWVLPHAELLRFRKEGLLPLTRTPG